MVAWCLERSPSSTPVPVVLTPSNPEISAGRHWWNLRRLHSFIPCFESIVQNLCCLGTRLCQCLMSRSAALTKTAKENRGRLSCLINYLRPLSGTTSGTGLLLVHREPLWWPSAHPCFVSPDTCTQCAGGTECWSCRLVGSNQRDKQDACAPSSLLFPGTHLITVGVV